MGPKRAFHWPPTPHATPWVPIGARCFACAWGALKLGGANHPPKANQQAPRALQACSQQLLGHAQGLAKHPCHVLGWHRAAMPLNALVPTIAHLNFIDSAKATAAAATVCCRPAQLAWGLLHQLGGVLGAMCIAHCHDNWQMAPPQVQQHCWPTPCSH